jgi:hypothetical protein
MSTTHGTEALTGTVRNGQVILDSPARWPEGCRVVVIREALAEPPGTVGDEQADDAESIARWIAAFDAIPPLEMTPEEEAAWQGARDAQRREELARFDERARRIEASFPSSDTSSTATPRRTASSGGATFMSG